MPQDVAGLCPACFKPTNPSPTCSDCGADASTRRPAGVLPLWTRLYAEGRYLIGRVLGQGGFGVTYAAWDETLQQVIAVKELYPRNSVARATDSVTVEPDTDNDAAAFVEAREKFLEEARLLVRPSLKSNAGIITVENFFEANGTVYTVMEYLEGQTLEDYVEFMGGKLSPDDADMMMGAVLDALGAVHQERLGDDSVMIHRDIKPQNIYLTHGGQIKLLDFGAARFAGGQQDRSATAIGTEGYAALEQYTRKTQGPWTDVYGAGATWYHMVTGKKPEEAFLRSSEDEDPLKPPSALKIDIAPHIEAAWMRALAVRPQDRWASVEDLQTALAGSLEEGAAAPVAVEPGTPNTEPEVPVPEVEPSPASVSSPETPSERKTPAPVKQGTPGWIWGVVGVVAIIILYMGYLQWEPEGPETPEPVALETPDNEEDPLDTTEPVDSGDMPSGEESPDEADDFASDDSDDEAALEPESESEPEPEAEPPPPSPQQPTVARTPPRITPGPPPRLAPSSVAGITATTIKNLFTRDEAQVSRSGTNTQINLYGLKFSIGRASFTSESHDLLARVLQAVNLFPNARIKIDGHTDSVGDSGTNQRLSQARADALRDFLVANTALTSGMITTKGYGPSMPIDTNRTAEGRARNRRLEVTIEAEP